MTEAQKEDPISKILQVSTGDASCGSGVKKTDRGYLSTHNPDPQPVIVTRNKGYNKDGNNSRCR